MGSNEKNDAHSERSAGHNNGNIHDRFREADAKLALSRGLRPGETDALPRKSTNG